MRSLIMVRQQVVACRLCPRLVTYRERIAKEKRRQYQDWTYWGRPVPGFGDPQARLFVVGLAPAAHGGNRTGRVFTGDRSGDWLYEALHTSGLPTSRPRRTKMTDSVSRIATLPRWCAALRRITSPCRRSSIPAGPI